MQSGVSPDQRGWLALALVAGVGPAHFQQLLDAFGEPAQILATSPRQLESVVGPATAQAISQATTNPELQRHLEWLQQPHTHVVTLADASYPELLREIHPPPPILYVLGDPAWLKQPSLAVVGSRNATAQGVRNAEDFAGRISEAGLTIVSGLAAGIDAAAHRGGLQGVGSTVAVVGTGLDRVYPASSRELAHRIAERGALVSEFPLGTPVRAGHFPRRNRIISGLSLGCLVVEAALESGSLITARLAGEQGREVFAIPGSIHSPLSRGNHQLIRQGAKLVESAQDILEELAPFVRNNLPPAAAMIDNDTDPILTAMSFDPVSIDTLAERTRLTTDALCAMLLTLELDGRVARLPGNLYQRLAG